MNAATSQFRCVAESLGLLANDLATKVRALAQLNEIPLTSVGAEERRLRSMIGYAILGGVQPAMLADIAPYWDAIDFRAAQPIYSEGDAADRLYIIVSGTVKLSRMSISGRAVLTIMGPTDMIGASSVFDRGPRRAGATALTKVRAVSIDQNGFRSMILNYPGIAEQLLQMVARRVRRTDNDRVDLVCTDAPGRIAKRLMQLAQRFGTPEAGALRVAPDLTQAEMAELAGTSRETVNKSLSDFVDRGWIKIDSKGVLIHDPQRLARRAR
jgi:CRP/FNR family cyclic AMP-dependent transcriptional regulator